MNILQLLFIELLDSRIASLPSKFHQALIDHDEKAMKESVDRNFDLRLEIWGEKALGGRSGPNLRMIEVVVCDGDNTDCATPWNGSETVWFRRCDRDDSGIQLS